MIVLIGLGIFVWMALGAYGFIFWWTKDFPFTYDDLGMTFLASISGPVTFLMGYFIHQSRNDKVLIKKRDSK